MLLLNFVLTLSTENSRFLLMKPHNKMKGHEVSGRSDTAGNSLFQVWSFAGRLYVTAVDLPVFLSHAQLSTDPSTFSVLNDSIKSLERSLGILSGKLSVLCSQIPVDHVVIGEVATSMKKASDALRALKRMRYQENSTCA